MSLPQSQCGDLMPCRAGIAWGGPGPRKLWKKKCIGWVRESGVSWLDAEESSSSWVSPFTVRLWRVRSAYLFGKDLIHGAWSGKDIRVQPFRSKLQVVSRCITIFWRFISRFISYGLIFTIYSNIVLYHVDIIDIHVLLIHPWGR